MIGFFLLLAMLESPQKSPRDRSLALRLGLHDLITACTVCAMVSLANTYIFFSYLRLISSHPES